MKRQPLITHHFTGNKTADFARPSLKHNFNFKIVSIADVYRAEIQKINPRVFEIIDGESGWKWKRKKAIREDSRKFTQAAVS